MTENPFDNASATTAVDETPTPVEVEDLDVDAPTAGTDEAEDTVEAPAAGDTKAPKTAKAKKGPARPQVPDGYIMPVAFARELTKHLAAKGASNKHGKIDPDTNAIPPQQVYSMMRTNGADSKNPFPVHEVEGFESPVLKLEEALAWWDAKDERVASSKAAKAEKAAKKAEKGTADESAPSDAAGSPPVEAE